MGSIVLKFNRDVWNIEHLKPFQSLNMAKYSKKAQDKVEEVMREKKRGTLKSGSGKKVTSRKQAIAIGLSEAREAGAKVPKKPAARTGKKTATKKTAKKKTATKKKAARKRSS
jgi:hypothetical protein